MSPTTLDDYCRAVGLAYTANHATGFAISRVKANTWTSQMFVMRLDLARPMFVGHQARLDALLTDVRAAIAFMENPDRHIYCALLLSPGLCAREMRELNFPLWELVEAYTGTLGFEEASWRYESPLLAYPGSYA